MTPKPKVARLSLADFVAAKKRAACKVCQLSVQIRGQLREAAQKRIPRGEQLEWLKQVHSANITAADLQAHVNARHET